MIRAVVLVAAVAGCGKRINPAWCEQSGNSDPACDLVADADRAMPQIACVTDEACPDTACLATGVCADPREVLYASPDGTGAACTRAARCGLRAAIAAATPDRRVILLDPGTYTGGLVLDSSVHLVGARARLVPDAAGNAVTITGEAEVELDHVSITGALGGSAIACTGGSLVGRAIRVNHNQHGIASACRLTLERSLLTDNREGALEITAGTIDVRNNVIVFNGHSGFGATGNVTIARDVNGRFAFNTVAYNDARQNGNPGVDCESDAVTTEGNLITDNTRRGMFNSGPQVTGQCSFVGSYTAPGAGNNDVAWVSVGSRDFHLTAGSVLAIDRAGATCGIDSDLDGELRPSGDACDFGADELIRE